MLNKYMWSLYLEARGRKIVDTFRNNIINGISEEYISFIHGLQGDYCANSEILENTQDMLQEVCAIVKQDPPGPL